MWLLLKYTLLYAAVLMLVAALAGLIYSSLLSFSAINLKADQTIGGTALNLLATSHPIGTIFSALFVSYIQVGGESMQPHFAVEMIDIIISVIIYLAAFALLTKDLIGRLVKTDKGNVNAEPAPEEAPAAPDGAGKEDNV